MLMLQAPGNKAGPALRTIRRDLRNCLFLPFCVFTSLCLIAQSMLCLNAAFFRQVMQSGHFLSAKPVDKERHPWRKVHTNRLIMRFCLFTDLCPAAAAFLAHLLQIPTPSHSISTSYARLPSSEAFGMKCAHLCLLSNKDTRWHSIYMPGLKQDEMRWTRSGRADIRPT